jgi:thiol-disulfide isomerase/thioredoxin
LYVNAIEILNLAEHMSEEERMKMKNRMIRRIAGVALLFCLSDVTAAIAVAAPQASKRSSAPDPKIIDAQGYQELVEHYRGKPLLVTFWATWCEPCRDEFPLLVELHKQYAPQGLAIFGVSLDDDADMNLVRRFLARNQPGFSNYRQKPGIDVDAFYRGVNPAWTGTMPETIFYGRDGHIIGHFVGAQPRAAFEEGIRQVLASPGAQSNSH